MTVSWAAAAAAIAVGGRRLDSAAIPRVAVLSAAFFVVSLIRVPLAPAAAHLVLNGVIGVLLAWCVFPALAANGQEFSRAVAALVAVPLPVAAIEAMVVAAVLSFLARVAPELPPGGFSRCLAGER